MTGWQPGDRRNRRRREPLRARIIDVIGLMLLGFMLGGLFATGSPVYLVLILAAIAVVQFR
ncbi:MAG: hypothetical protein M0Q49_05615 [Porticoccaceae bacterium]|nr:hypothetical protein [Porticoccaceae bacterium]